jgi:DNA-binding LacI/PurR family transcriptional regulator
MLALLGAWVARALGTGRRNTVGLVVADVTNPRLFGVIRGVSRHLTASGYTTVLGESELDPHIEAAVVDRLRPAVDGFILASSRLPSSAISQLAATVPTVLIDRQVDGVASVVNDDVGGTRQLVEHLARLGHRRIAFLGGPRQSWSGATWWRTLWAAGRDLGIETTHLGPFTLSTTGGAAAAEAGLASGYSALMAHNDPLAIGVLRRLGRWVSTFRVTSA